ncbi:ComEC/Rec2 family competence protein [Flavobacterium lacisediminis]|uniref:Competence protein ComEC family protein n=1 Tax=Flavobacterium lacisediminis TaxID=2989705 RepID=A0ABT3EHN4_9FLAO|nr:ComEC/Rec2 family competence protein [Flavobacterium lacisediminis]MCW1148090.1 competence protein ComEC family protein [Flavobacterium lacisediminis]
MKVFKFPLLTITISFAIGIIAEYNLQWSLSTLIVSLFLCLGIFCFLFWKSKKALLQNTLFGIATYLLAFTLGMMSFYIHSDLNSKNHYSKKSFEETNSIRAIVSTTLKPNEKYNKYFITLSHFNDTIASGQLLLYVPKTNNETLHSGDEIWLNNAVYPIQKTFNPYQFDYSKYLEKQNVFHQIYTRENQIKIIQTHKTIDFYIETLRNNLSKSFDIHHFEPKTKAIIDALILGQRLELDKETIADYSNAGVIHILAISGLHISIIYFFIVFLLKPLKRVKFGAEIQLLIVLGILWLFALLTGLPASVTRAVTLFSFISIGNYFNQPKAIYNALAISAFLILLVKPNAIFDIGFQLSYAAVLSIVLFQPFYKKFYFSENKIAIYFTDTVLVSLAAQIGVLPLSLYYFNQLPLLFLLANLVIIPLSSLVLIAGIIILPLNYVLPSVAVFLGKILEFSIQFMNNYIHWIAQFKSGIITNISFSGWLTFSLYLVIIAFAYWLYHIKDKNIKYILGTLLLFQLSYISIKWSENNSSELVVFNEKTTLIGIKNKNNVIAFSDIPENHNVTLNHYTRGTFSDSLRIFPMQNAISFQEKRILVIDSLGIYKTSIRPEIILLTQNPKINLSRLILEMKPKEIIADKSNYKNTIKAWEATCRKEKIPFHAIAEKGFYRLK